VAAHTPQSPMRLLVRSSLAAAACAVSAALPVHAQFTQYYGPNTGFVSNSATGAYLAAIGGGTQYHLDFNTDALGNALSAASTQISGAIFSTFVTLSSIPTGGSASSLVNYTGAGAGSEVGVTGTWNGILNIDFISNGFVASAFGFGGVQFVSGSIIRIYDQNNVLVRTDVTNQPDMFGFYGYVSDGTQQIGRIELQGAAFAIQDLSFSAPAAGNGDGPVTATPEPATLALMAPGVVGLLGFRHLRKRKTT